MEYIIAIALGILVGFLLRSKRSSIDEQSIRLKHEKEAQEYRQKLFQEAEEQMNQRREE
jgi:hypothetical protein